MTSDKLQVMKAALEKWEKTPYLEGIHAKWNRLAVATILENQRVVLENTKFPDWFERQWAYELIQQVFTGFMPFNLVSVQPLTKPEDNCYYLQTYLPSQKAEEPLETDVLGRPIGKITEEINLSIKEVTLSSATKWLRPRISPETIKRENWKTEVAEGIRNHWTREIVTDIRNNADTVVHFDMKEAYGNIVREKYESLFTRLVEASNIVARKNLRGAANWLVCGEHFARMFTEFSTGHFDVRKATKPVYLGTVHNRWKAYYDPVYPKNQAVFGYLGDSYMDSGYIFSPYVFLDSMFVQLNPDTFDPSWTLLARMKKRLIPNGSKFYGRMVVENWDDYLIDYPKEPHGSTSE